MANGRPTNDDFQTLQVITFDDPRRPSREWFFKFGILRASAQGHNFIKFYDHMGRLSRGVEALGTQLGRTLEN